MSLPNGIPKRVEDEGLVEYAERLSEAYEKTQDVETRKARGQILTPKEVSRFMAKLFKANASTARLLDPGAGTGTLTAAFCEWAAKENKLDKLVIDTYENDSNVLPFLKRVLEECKKELGRTGCSVEFNIHTGDFVLNNAHYFTKLKRLNGEGEKVFYDFVISNPPYYKLNKNSPQATVMKELVSGQPNVYALFMALSASMVKPGGEMVFITPRSFCSGLYYKKFTEWFVSNVQIRNIHSFESRKEIFESDGILQENVIIKGVKSKKPGSVNEQGLVTVSVSRNGDFKNIREIRVKAKDIVYRQNGHLFIRIPTAPVDIEIFRIIKAWSKTLKDLGLEISTGPVVAFRAKEYLLPNMTQTPKSVPFLWMHNTKDMETVWPLKKNGKEGAIRVCAKTKALLLPVKNYVLLKRFTSKEQNRRLYAAVLSASEFPYEAVGIENHVNYIHKPHGELSVYETFGIATILNTVLIDKFFRSLNGNTQVNATEIRSLPLPELEDIKKIGQLVYEAKSTGKDVDLDAVVADVLGISGEIIQSVEAT